MTNKKLHDRNGHAVVPLASRQMTPYSTVTFDEPPMRVCNASSNKELTVEPHPEAERIARNKAIPSRGQGC